MSLQPYFEIRTTSNQPHISTSSLGNGILSPHSSSSSVMMHPTTSNIIDQNLTNYSLNGLNMFSGQNLNTSSGHCLPPGVSQLHNAATHNLLSHQRISQMDQQTYNNIPSPSSMFSPSLPYFPLSHAPNSMTYTNLLTGSNNHSQICMNLGSPTDFSLPNAATLQGQTVNSTSSIGANNQSNSLSLPPGVASLPISQTQSLLCPQLFSSSSVNQVLTTSGHLDIHKITENKVKTVMNSFIGEDNSQGKHQCHTCSRWFKLRSRLLAHERRHHHLSTTSNNKLLDATQKFIENSLKSAAVHNQQADDNKNKQNLNHATGSEEIEVTSKTIYRQRASLGNNNTGSSSHGAGLRCPHCPRSFPTSSSLTMHVKWKHQGPGAMAKRKAISRNLMVSNATPNASGRGSLLSDQGGYCVRPLGPATYGTVGLEEVLNEVQAGAPIHCRLPVRTTFSSTTTNSDELTTATTSGMYSKQHHTNVNVNSTPIHSSSSIVVDPESGLKKDSKGRLQMYHCEICQRSFTFACRLQSHMRCHTNDRPFQCLVCHRCFTQPGYLARHSAVHKQERPFDCIECGRTYKHYGSLVNHRKIHERDKMRGSIVIGSKGLDDTLNFLTQNLYNSNDNHNHHNNNNN